MTDTCGATFLTDIEMHKEQVGDDDQQGWHADDKLHQHGGCITEMSRLRHPRQAIIRLALAKKGATPFARMLLLLIMRLINVCYETSMALVTFSFGSVFGIVMVRMPSSTLAEILSRTTSSGSE